jgi:TonB family protein
MKGLIIALSMMVFSALGVQAQEANKERVLSGGVLNGKATSLPKPDYPSHLKDQDIGGSVSVSVVIDESGIVISAAAQPVNIKIKKADGTVEERRGPDRALLDAAENAARLARFSPTLLNGEPVKISGILVYNFAPLKSETASDDKTISDTIIYTFPPPKRETANDDKKISGGVLNGKAVELPLPDYPDAAKAVKAGGAVSVLVVIDETGEVVESEAVSGHPLLRGAAVDASRQAKFSPTVLNGQAVRVKGVLVYNFVN